MALPKVVPYSLRTLDDTLKNILSSGKIYTAKELIPLVKKKMLTEKDDSEVLGYIMLRLEKAEVFLDYGGRWGTAKLQDKVHDTVEEILIAEDTPLIMPDILKAVHTRIGPVEELSLEKDGRFVEYEGFSWGLSSWLVRDVLSPRQLDQVYILLSNSPPLKVDAISQQLFDQPAAANDLENKISLDKRFCKIGIYWSVRKANSQQTNFLFSKHNNIISDNVLEVLNRVGKAVFVKYYYEFKTKSNQECIKVISEPYTDKSKASRTSKAKRIFRDNMHGEALRLITESGRLDGATMKRAREIMNEELPK